MDFQLLLQKSTIMSNHSPFIFSHWPEGASSSCWKALDQDLHRRTFMIIFSKACGSGHGTHSQKKIIIFYISAWGHSDQSLYVFDVHLVLSVLLLRAIEIPTRLWHFLPVPCTCTLSPCLQWWGSETWPCTAQSSLLFGNGRSGKWVIADQRFAFKD